MLTDNFERIFSNKKKVLFVFAHPDDTEIMAGGTIARLIKEGYEVGVAKMTLGNKGSRQEKISEDELKHERFLEDQESMKKLGVEEKNNFYLNFPDGSVENDLKTIEALVRVIRTFKPELIVTHNPEDVLIRWSEGISWVNHRDHRNTGKSVIDAAYPYSRDILFFSEQLVDGKLESHCCSEFLLADYYDHKDTIAIDVTDSIEKKSQALACHKSQFESDKVSDLVDFITNIDNSQKRYERFRYVKAD